MCHWRLGLEIYRPILYFLCPVPFLLPAPSLLLTAHEYNQLPLAPVATVTCCRALPTVMDCIANMSPSKPVFPSICSHWQGKHQLAWQPSFTVNSLSPSLLSFLPLFLLCVFRGDVQTRACVCGSQRSTSWVFPLKIIHLMLFKTRSLTGTWALPIGPGWLAISPMHLPVTTAPAWDHQLPLALTFDVGLRACTESTPLAKLSPSLTYYFCKCPLSIPVTSKTDNREIFCKVNSKHISLILCAYSSQSMSTFPTKVKKACESLSCIIHEALIVQGLSCLLYWCLFNPYTMKTGSEWILDYLLVGKVWIVSWMILAN